VQGAQTAARWFVLIFLAGTHGTLAVTQGISSGQGAASTLLCIASLAAIGLFWWAGEDDA